MIKTAVVILNWNGEAMLRQFLPSVIACSRLEGTEIYVADNASTDASCEVVEKEFPSVHLIRLDKNYGFADGYNYALQKIDAEYAVLLNSDVEVTEGWLQPMVDYLDTHPETVACQPKIRAEPFFHDARTDFYHCGGRAGHSGCTLCVIEIRKPLFIEERAGLPVLCFPDWKRMFLMAEPYVSRQGNIRFCAGRRKKCRNVFLLSL